LYVQRQPFVVVISIPQVHAVLKASLKLISPPAVFAASGNSGGPQGSPSAFLRNSSGIHASLAQNCTLICLGFRR